MSGWEVLPVDPARPRKREGVGERERREFPGFYESGLWLQGSGGPVRPGYFTPGRPPERTTERVATGPVTYTGHDAIRADTDALTKALSGKPAETEGFVAALGPLSLGAGARNEYYSSEEEYMMAVAEASGKSTRRSPTRASSCRSTSQSSRPRGSSTPTGT